MVERFFFSNIDDYFPKVMITDQVGLTWLSPLWLKMAILEMQKLQILEYLMQNDDIDHIISYWQSRLSNAPFGMG